MNHRVTTIRRALRRLPILALCGLLTGCPGWQIDPGSAEAPSLIGREGTIGWPYGGFIYPPSGPVEYPGQWSSAGRLEVDAPLRAVRRSNGRAELAGRYYAFTVNVRVEGLRTLQLQWRAGNNAWVAKKVDGPCDAQAGPAARQFMHDTALRETGRESVAAYDLPTNDALAIGEILWWVTCEPDRPGEILGTSPARVDYNVAVLLPQSKFREGAGALWIRSKPLGEGKISEALKLPISETPRIFAVVGDSMAWGQGLNYQEKWWWQVYLEARDNNNDAFERLYVRAHSASHLNGGSSTIAASVNRDCRPSNVHQELPFGADSVQCQLVHVSRPRCRIDAAMLNVPGIVPSMACEQKPDAEPEALIGIPDEDMGTPLAVDIDHGPRIDMLFMDGCINDVGAVRIHTDLDGSLNTLANDIDRECDVTNSVPDLRDAFPNANINWLGYHRTWSDQSAVLNPLRCPASVAIPAMSSVAPWPLSFMLQATTQSAVDDIGERAGLFFERSNQMLAASIATLAGDAPGRGQIRFVPLTFFDESAAAYAPQSGNWELNCLDPALQTTDSVLNQRYTDCAAAIDVLTLEDLAQGVDWFGTDWSNEAALQAALLFCQRAPFLHPDREANEQMGKLLIETLGNAL